VHPVTWWKIILELMDVNTDQPADNAEALLQLSGTFGGKRQLQWDFVIGGYTFISNVQQ
jgi:hypothetical protein